MKKIVFLAGLVLLTAFLLVFAFRNSNERTLASNSKQPSSAAMNQHRQSRAMGKDADDFGAASAALAIRISKDEPAAVDQYIELVGACHGAQHIRDDVQPGRDMARLQNFCRAYTDGLVNGDYSSWVTQHAHLGFARKMKEELNVLRTNMGDAAVSAKLQEVIDSKDPYRTQAALDYSADTGIIPYELKKLDQSNRIDNAHFAEAISTASLLQLCRRTNQCGFNSFETIKACVVIGPCQPNESLISLLRRTTSPDVFALSLRIDSAL